MLHNITRKVGQKGQPHDCRTALAVPPEVCINLEPLSRKSHDISFFGNYFTNKIQSLLKQKLDNNQILPTSGQYSVQ